MSPPPLIRLDADSLAWLDAAAIVRLTEAATETTFYREGLTPEQIAANRRIVEISGPTALAAAGHSHQHFAAAFVGEAFAGYMIATRHGASDHELDWLMVHPDFHGSGVAPLLMQAGIDWLGRDRPMWLNVIRFNDRAIRFYRRFGFEIDPATVTEKVVPNWVMRRPGDMV
ncbi:MAG: GNAT family N-acetyltransferase [Allosphingosinicella sp.]